MINRVLLWFRQDFRLADNGALLAAHGAAGDEGEVVCVYIHDQMARARPLGAASRWGVMKSLLALKSDLISRGSDLFCFRGDSLIQLLSLCAETVARQIFCNALPNPQDEPYLLTLFQALKDHGIELKRFSGALLMPAQGLKTMQGGGYQVFGAFLRRLRLELFPTPLRPAPKHWRPLSLRPVKSVPIEALKLYEATPDWASGFCGDRYLPGETGAWARLEQFLDEGLLGYGLGRDRPDLRQFGSGLSAHLHFGEITSQRVLSSVLARSETLGSDADGEKFLSELIWREFSYHLLGQCPDLHTKNFRSGFDHFPWREDAAGFTAWKHGLTGYPLVDAGMRQLWQTGFMHNRVRMVVASFLVKHLLIDWRLGEAWFWQTLIDADAANNPANWQWVAGCGADAAPYFRVFNPVLQGQKFDPDGAYVRTFVPELSALPPSHIHAPWTLSSEQLLAAGVVLGQTYPGPFVDHGFARNRALMALKSLSL